jgi:hypothetical protein
MTHCKKGNTRGSCCPSKCQKYMPAHVFTLYGREADAQDEK